MDLDVLAVQKVENIDIPKEFNRGKLNGLYDHIVLIEGDGSDHDPAWIELDL